METEYVTHYDHATMQMIKIPVVKQRKPSVNKIEIECRGSVTNLEPNIPNLLIAIWACLKDRSKTLKLSDTNFPDFHFDRYQEELVKSRAWFHSVEIVMDKLKETYDLTSLENDADTFNVITSKIDDIPFYLPAPSF